eukprot:scaffold1499_cov170-Amphora_coffeaeformis.AAC.22
MDAKNVNQEVGKNKRKSLSDEDDSMRNEKAPRNDSGPSSVDKGQDNDDDDEDLRKLEEKRAYNRKNAARARQRTKEHILELTARAERYASRNEELQQANDSLMAEVKKLTEENQRLRQLANMTGSSPVGPGVTSASVGLPSLGGAPMGQLPPGLGGPMIMDQAGLHGGSGTTSYYIVPPPQQHSDSSTGGSQNANDSNAARQRGFLLQLLQSQGDARQGLPPGFNPY